MQYESFPLFDKPPCVWASAPVRLIALLRDPAERAQVLLGSRSGDRVVQQMPRAGERCFLLTLLDGEGGDSSADELVRMRADS